MENPNYRSYTGKYRHNYYKYLSSIVDETTGFVLDNLTKKEADTWEEETYNKIIKDIGECKAGKKNNLEREIGIHAIYVADEEKQLNPSHKNLLKKLRDDGYDIDIVPDPHPKILPLSHNIIIKISR